MVLAVGLRELATLLPPGVVENNLLPKCIDLSSSKVPNLRLNLVPTFEAVARANISAGVTSKVQAKLMEMTKDEDVDVKQLAESAMNDLEAAKIF